MNAHDSADGSKDADARPTVSRATRPNPIAHYAPARPPAEVEDEEDALPRAS